jgi:hypothetical protein
MPTDLTHPIRLLVKKLSNYKGQLTTSDAVAATGLALHEAKDALRLMMEQYVCRLQVTASGEMVYSFGAPLRRRGEKTFKEIMYDVAEKFWRGFMIFFKIWIAVTLVVYFIIMVILIVALIVAALAGSKGGSSSSRKSSSGSGFIGPIFRAMGEAFWLATATGNVEYRNDKQGYRTKTYIPPPRPKLTKPEQQTTKKKFIQSVYDYVFGPARPPFDPLANEKEVAAFLRDSKGVLAPAEVIGLAGWTFNQADERMTEYLVRFSGEPVMTDDGVVYGKFSDMLRSTSEGLEGGKVELFWHEYEPPYELTGNTKGRNVGITFMNAFNLIAAPILAVGGLETLEIDSQFAGIFLGVIPIIFSTLFFLIPFIRLFVVRRQERARRERNCRRQVMKVIFKNPGKMFTLKDISNAIRESGDPLLDDKTLQATLDKLVIDLQGRTDLAEDGTVVYLFPRLQHEYETAQNVRRELPKGEAGIGDVVFDSGH